MVLQRFDFGNRSQLSFDLQSEFTEGTCLCFDLGENVSNVLDKILRGAIKLN
jgi:hypothetical protein